MITDPSSNQKRSRAHWNEASWATSDKPTDDHLECDMNHNAGEQYLVFEIPRKFVEDSCQLRSGPPEPESVEMTPHTNTPLKQTWMKRVKDSSKNAP